MPTATLTFSLPEEQAEFDAAIYGTAWRCVAEEVLREIRSKLKYGAVSPDGAAAYEALRDIVYAEMASRGLEENY